MESSGATSAFEFTAQAKIDDKGRLKVPNTFRAVIEKNHGTKLVVTSVTGESVLIYPLSAWNDLRERLKKAASTNPSRQRLLFRLNVYGQPAELDSQGRVVIPSRLRESAQVTGDVDVVGQDTFLEVWNSERLAAKLAKEPYTDDDGTVLSGLGI